MRYGKYELEIDTYEKECVLMNILQNVFLKDKVVILTGATGGIGQVIAKALAARNMRLMLTGRNPGKLQQLAESVRAIGGDAATCIANLFDPEAIDLIINATLTVFGNIDMLINNAGLAQNTAFADVTAEEYDRIVTLNTKAPYFLTQKALPHLLKSDFATVINIASVVAHKGYVQQSVYAASKSALLGWSKSLAAEYYKKNLRVHVISPGGVYTEMVALSRPDLMPDEMIQPEIIADTILFLLEHRHTNAVIDEIGIHRANKEPFL
ncbi:MAG TPA: SDR family oxidoreductase [Clostridiaceae bacterium]|nr:SDR family oxidoreductase [Clostridiaceae bacterium]